MSNCQVSLIDSCDFEWVKMMVYFKVTSLYGGFANNIHGTTTIDNHFHKRFSTPNKGIEYGGTFSLIAHDWVGQ